MITKGYIEKLPEMDSNIFIVRIPLFETASIGYTEDKLSTSNFEATLCYQPGNFKGYYPSPRARHPRMWNQVGLRKHLYKQS